MRGKDLLPFQSHPAYLLGFLFFVAVGSMCAAKLAKHRVPRADPQPEMDRVSERLRAFDAEQRLRADFAHLPTWDQLSGPDPYAVARVPRSSRLVGILRGADALVVLDENAHEVQRVPAPAAPVALAVAEDGSIFVAGELSTTLARFAWKNDRVEPAGTWQLDDLRAIRAIAAGDSNWVYVAEEHEGRVIALRLEHRSPAADRIAERREMGTCRGPIRAARAGNRLIVDCLLDHALVIHRLNASGAPSDEPRVTIRHDGPIWGFDAVAIEDALIIAAGGVEDHPLDRTIGAFGYIDSFLFLYRLGDQAKAAVRDAALNLSELGVITPKAIVLRENPLTVAVAGYGSDKLVELSFPGGPGQPPVVRARDSVPGTSAMAALDDGRFVFANPLYDAWIVANRVEQPKIVPVAGAPDAKIPDAELRLGEALFFTTLMAPFNRSDGALSRFTCETCHFEGYVDGRTHHTGRGDVHAVTKPLLGLFNNRPHFSRALDPDLTAVVFNEFRVAGAKSERDPWFTLSTDQVPWTELLGETDAALSPEALRKALMRFLIAFQHRPNPAVLGRASFSDKERRGAAAFHDRCESCHEARLASDQPQTRVPYERWESLVMAREGAVVWGKDVYAETGVVPYVHEKGARVPSLRRLYKKHPYFTNGSASSLEEVLARARFLESGFQHDRPAHHADPGDGQGVETALDAPIREALLAFLRLL